MVSFKIFTSIYHFFGSRRKILFAGTLSIVALSIAAFANMDISEDISLMLPDGQSDLSVDFDLLQRTPFAHKVIVNLKGSPSTSSSDLIEAVDRLADAMTPPLFGRVVSGPPGGSNMALFAGLIQALPSITTRQDLNGIEKGLTADGIRARLSDIYDKLVTPEGWLMKGMLQADPLELRSIAIDKLHVVNLISGMQIKENHFVSADGKNALLFADTPIAITDSRGGEELLNHFQDLVSSVIPPSIDVSMISAHRYTTANAGIIKGDLYIVLGCSALAILILFLIWLRSWRAFLVFLVPASVLSLASVGVSLVYNPVSAITIGFGAVLLGISVDFALHVYFALRGRQHDPAVVIGEVSRPVLFGGLTTLVAFAVLIFSNLPGQRQLAVFSMIGIGASLIISMIVLPHLVRPARDRKRDTAVRSEMKFSLPPWAVLSVWILLLVLCAWQGTRLHFNGDLKSLNKVPAELRAAEDQLAQVWGNFRGNAMIFSEGPDLQAALDKNDRLFEYLSERIESEKIVSLAPILPSAITQRSNLERWRSFWSEKGVEVRKLLEKEGKSLGFSPKAFAPFFDRLAEQAAPVSPEDLRALGLGDLLDSLIIRVHDRVQVLTLIPDTPEVISLVSKEFNRFPGIRLVSQTRFGEIVGREIGRDFIGFIVKAFVLVVLFLSVLFWDLKKVLYALVPVVSGLIFMFGIMGWAGIGFNLFNIVATILIIGLGVDYGIFIVCKVSEGYKHDTHRAVLVSGLTTLAGFGALVLARHPALHSIGVTVILGIGAAIPSALLVIPALYRRGPK